jgi:mRNA interferase MazF
MSLPDPKQGEIWRIDLNPTQGDEIAKTRPCVVVGNDDVGKLQLRIVVPVTDWKEHYARYPWMSRLEPDEENGLVKSSAADCFQVRAVSLARFKERLGTISDERSERIFKALSLCLRTPRS